MSDLIPVHLALLRAAGRADTTIDARKGVLYRADAALPYGLDDAHTDELALYLGRREWARWTRNLYWRHLNGFYAWGVEAGHYDLNPVAGVPRPPAGDSLPDPCTDGELRLALERSPDQPWRLAIVLAAYAGLRASELAVIRREDITESHVLVRQGKGGEDALVETAPELWDFVKDRLRGPLIRSPGAIGNQYRHFHKIGMPELHLHRFRHWYGTALLKAGNDLRTVQELLRHKSIVSTQGYTQVVDRQRRLAICTLPTLTTGLLGNAA